MNEKVYVRTIDETGRIFLPNDVRNTMGLNVGTPVEITVNLSDQVLMIRKQPPTGNDAPADNQ